MRMVTVKDLAHRLACDLKLPAERSLAYTHLPPAPLRAPALDVELLCPSNSLRRQASARSREPATSRVSGGVVCHPVQLGTAGALPTQLFTRLALIGALVVVMVPPWR